VKQLSNSSLGIYIAKDRATVACVQLLGRQRNLAGFFAVSLDSDLPPNLPSELPATSRVEPEKSAVKQVSQPNQAGTAAAEEQPVEEPSPIEKLVARIAAGCAEKQFKFDDIAVALDCSMFMQHSIHSEFADARRVTQTVRFDTEEALATDASDVAIAFKISSADKAGSNLNVFTAPKNLLGELLTVLLANNLDAVSVEPDVSALSRFLCHGVALPHDTHPMFCLLSQKNGYFVTPLSKPWLGVSPMAPAEMRTFLLGNPKNRTDLLTREIRMTIAQLGSAVSLNRLEVFDAAGEINYGQIARNLATETVPVDIVGPSRLPSDVLPNCLDVVEFAIAYGAAIWKLNPPETIDWRNDFMPYQGGKLRLQSAIKLLCVAVTALLLAIGVLGFTYSMQIKKDRTMVREKFAKDYAAFMFGQTMPGKTREAVRRLDAARRRIRENQKNSISVLGDDAVAGKLNLVLQAFNKCASATGLNIDSVRVTDKSITISGDTSSPDNTLKVFDALRQSNLNILQQNMYTPGDGRGHFNVSVEPKSVSDKDTRPPINAVEPPASTAGAATKPAPAIRSRRARGSQ
jgi:hypothetical protein